MGWTGLGAWHHDLCKMAATMDDLFYRLIHTAGEEDRGAGQRRH